MGLIVDTGVFILIERSGAQVGLNIGAGTVAVASITMSELWVGAHRANSETRRNRRLDFIDNFAFKLPNWLSPSTPRAFTPVCTPTCRCVAN